MVKNMPETGRNDPCPCGSGKKYKKCCRNTAGGKIFQDRYWVYIVLVVLFGLSLFLRYYGFRQPHGLTFDEGLYAELLANQLKENPANYSTQEAYRIHTAQGTRLPEYLDRPLFKHPPLYSYLIALSYKFFGVGHLPAVSVSIVFGSLMVLAVFFLGKALYDQRVGLLAAFFLSIDPVHWVCSERIWMETTMSFFILLAVLLFALGQTKQSYLPLSGVSIGLAMLTKYPGLLALFIIVSFVILTDRALFKQKSFWVLCGLALLIFSPWVIWNWKIYGNFVEHFVSAHSLRYHGDNALKVLSEHKGTLWGFCFLAGWAWWTRSKLKGFINGKAQIISKQKVFLPLRKVYRLLGAYVFPSINLEENITMPASSNLFLRKAGSENRLFFPLSVWGKQIGLCSAKFLREHNRRKLSPQAIFSGTVCLLIFVITILFVPFLRTMAKEALVWKGHVLTGWSNPFASGPWYFYVTRLAELSPLYLFSYLSIIFVFGKNKGDWLLWLSSLWILGAFILLGNYQSRYILPAVPFLMILSARFQIWVYDALSVKTFNPKTAKLNALRPILKIAFTVIVFYFILKTLRVDGLIAIGPDYGYF